MVQLKVPKCVIFDRLDFHDFLTIKGATLGLKYFFFIFRGSFRAAKFLTRMLSLILRRIFLSLGKKMLFFVELLRQFVSVNSDVFKFF